MKSVVAQRSDNGTNYSLSLQNMNLQGYKLINFI